MGIIMTGGFAGNNKFKRFQKFKKSKRLLIEEAIESLKLTQKEPFEPLKRKQRIELI